MNSANLILRGNIYNLQNRFRKCLKLCTLKNYRLEGLRTLYGPSSLGLDEFTKHNVKIKEEYGDTNYVLNQLESVQTENEERCVDILRLLIAHCESDKTLIGDTIKLSKRYFDQVKYLPMKPYPFGPTLMQLLYIHHSVDEALQLIQDEEYEKFFNQISSYHIVMDKLFKMGKYEEIIILMNKIISEELFDIPWSCLILAMGANYRIGTEEALEDSRKLIDLIVSQKKRIHIRVIAFAAGLALKLEKTDTALEILEHSGSSTHFFILNLQMLSAARKGYIDNVFKILKSEILYDAPKSSRNNRKAFCYDVIEEVERIVIDNKDKDFEKITLIKRFAHAFDASNLLSNESLDEALFRPIQDVNAEDETKNIIAI